MLPLYEITYVFTAILGTYAIYKLMRAFFENVKTSRKIEFLSYAGYYLIGVALFFFARVPLIMLLVNIALLCSLTLNYKASIRKRIGTAFIVYMIVMCIESIVVFATEHINPSLIENSEYESVAGLIIIKVAVLFVVAFLADLQNVKKDIPVPLYYWAGMMFVAVATIHMMFSFLNNQQSSSQIEIVLVIISALSINIVILIIYDNLYKVFSDKSKELFRQRQHAAYERQLEIMRQSLSETDIFRHDIKKHLIVLKDLCACDIKKDAEAYIEKILQNAGERGKYVNSGNLVIDSILNFEIQAAYDMGIVPEIDVAIPQDVVIPTYETSAILWNLMDNALEALEKCDEERFLSASVKFVKGNLVVIVVNAYTGKIKTKNGRLPTRKSGSGHGLGLSSVEDALAAIDGNLNIEHDDKMFKARAIYPVQQ